MARMPLFNVLVLIRGAGDLGSGAAYRLVRAGFRVVMTELANPTLVRTTVSYGSCVLNRTVVVEGIEAQVGTPETVREMIDQGMIPVIIDPGRKSIEALRPVVVVDARVAKKNIDTTIKDAPLVVALGPGFTAGVDCHAVIETNRGHNLGRVMWEGSAEPDTGVPGSVDGKGADRVLRAPCDGVITQFVLIGERVKAGPGLGGRGTAPGAAP